MQFSQKAKNKNVGKTYSTPYKGILTDVCCVFMLSHVVTLHRAQTDLFADPQNMEDTSPANRLTNSPRPPNTTIAQQPS